MPSLGTGTPRSTKRYLDGGPIIIPAAPNIEGKGITKYFGLVSGEAILVVKHLQRPVGRDTGPSGRKIRGVRRGADEGQARALGANAVLGVDLDYETIGIGSGGKMLMLSTSGTAAPY